MSKVLVVVDMQNDFISGSLGTKEAQAIEDNAVAKIEMRKAEGYNIMVTLDTHTASYLMTQEGKKLPVEHCIKDTWGWQLAENVKKAVGYGARYYEKGTFGSVRMMEDLKQLEPESIEFIGLCTDICVVSNALGVKAWLPETPIYVDSSCCAGVTPEAHQAALDTMRSCQIVIEE